MKPTIWLSLTIPISILLTIAIGSELLIGGLLRGEPYFVSHRPGHRHAGCRASRSGGRCDSREPGLGTREAPLAGSSDLPRVHLHHLRVPRAL